MSNHGGSYMLNEILGMFEDRGVFRSLGKEQTHALLAKIVKRAVDQYDCNAGEILERVGKRLGICYYCLKPATKFTSEGICRACAAAPPSGIFTVGR
jgi:hypothetical protein